MVGTESDDGMGCVVDSNGLWWKIWGWFTRNETPLDELNEGYDATGVITLDNVLQRAKIVAGNCVQETDPYWRIIYLMQFPRTVESVLLSVLWSLYRTCSVPIVACIVVKSISVVLEWKINCMILPMRLRGRGHNTKTYLPPPPLRHRNTLEEIISYW